MADTFSDTARPQSGLTGKPAGTAPIEESFTENVITRGAGTGREEKFSDHSAIERDMPKGVLDRIAEIERRGKSAPAETVTETVVDEKPAAAPAATASAPPPPAEPPAEVPATPPTQATNADMETVRAERDRFEAANKALLAELDRAKAAPAPKPVNKLLLEAHDSYVETQIDAVKKLIASSLGIEDMADPRVDAELRDLYTDLTAHVLGVTPEESHLAKREAARARNLLAREKRERKAEEATSAERTQADAEARKAADAATFIGNRLATKRSDGKPLADDYPLLHQFAEALDGLKPNELIWKVLQHESKTGRIAITQDDDANITAAAKLIETHYQDLADRISKARPLPPSTQSTAKPSDEKSPTSTPSASKEQRQQVTARTLTSADASVAPATPPAPKTEAKESQRPKFKNDKERRDWALRHIPE